MDITCIKGVGEKRAELYKKIGVETAEQLITYYPRDYLDFSSPTDIIDLENDVPSVFGGKVVQKLKPYFGPRFNIFKAVVSDGTGEVLITFFNSEFTFSKLEVGKKYVFYGKTTGNLIRRECSSPLFIPVTQPNKLSPKYHLTSGLTANMITANVKAALEKTEIEEVLPQRLIEKYQLADYKSALHNIHFPADKEALEQAKRRLAFQELLVLQLGLSLLKKRSRRLAGVKMEDKPLDDFFGALPFSPTGAQIRSVKECTSDMMKSTPMSRLLQGDVGSGKTLVAAAVCYFTALNGCQSALMAPTEILAKQHYNTLKGFLEPLDIQVRLLTGSMSQKEKSQVKRQLQSGEAQVAVGTQALIQQDVAFNRLGLVVTDEQHRFGVRQRSQLAAKGENPHNLVMSATPIPRTLALMIYGDLDISVLDEMPKGRIPIRTYGVDSSYRPRLYNFIKKYVAEGKQAYIVCPLIGDDDEDASEKNAATAYYNELKKGAFADISVGLLHGKMKQADKDKVMSDFKRNKISVLVSTTVIEVGVDVPNAVVMLIENAEQFGLSQLHQLRGRVGRGNAQSHCVLVTDSKSDYTKARIDTMVKTCNGFEIANADLELRGPGDFFGSMQHGLPPLKMASMTEDMELVRQAQEAAKAVLEQDGKLKAEENAGLRKLVKELFSGGEQFGFN